MTWKLYAIVSAGAFAATYLMSTPQTQVVRPAAAASAARSARQAAAETEIEALADSLQVRRTSETIRREPGRNPFQFQSRPQKPPAFVPPPIVAENIAAPAPVLPAFNLSGIATDLVDGKPQRSAVLSAPAGVLIVREGESVAGLYVVRSIGEESIELEATADGSRRTLQLSGR